MPRLSDRKAGLLIQGYRFGSAKSVRTRVAQRDRFPRERERHKDRHLPRRECSPQPVRNAVWISRIKL